MTGTDGLVCRRCGRRYAADGTRSTCGDHEGADGLLDVEYDEAAVARALTEPRDRDTRSLWHYESILPTGGERVELGAGATPLLDAPALGAELGVDLALKDETANPTGSMKDRASAVMASRAVAGQAEVLACASTGNAAASLSAYAARAGLDCHIFVPDDVPEGKAVQPLIHGAEVTTVSGTYDDAFERCRQRSVEPGWLDCSAAVNPYGLEGLRTVGFELGQGMAEAPDWVVVPMGNGCGIAGIWKGLATCFRHGVIDSVPSMLGVQAAGACPIHERFIGDATADDATTDEDGTDADSIDVGQPHNADRACDALAESGGTSVAVTDEAILAAEGELARTEGVYVEPASAATVAGLRRARAEGIVERDDSVVLILTGSGLKDTGSARRVVDDHLSEPE